MKNLYTLAFVFLLMAASATAQVTGITPSSGVHNQTLQTTITSNGIFIQSSSPSGNIYQIRLHQGGANQIMIFNLGNWMFTTQVTDPNTAVADLTIPISVPAGVYDLEVIIGDVSDPTTNQFTYTLPAAFTVAPPDGYITGTVYHDLNENGIKDFGEPGISNRLVKIASLNYIVNTDGNGDYSFPVSNGTYDVSLQNSFGVYMFPTTNDTISVTVNNGNSQGNDFGLQHALNSITPANAYRGFITTHQIVSDFPIFFPGANPFGNINNVFIASTPGFYVNVNTSVTIIDSFTVQLDINVPVNTNAANGIDIVFYTQPGYSGYHYLKGMFNILTPTSFVSGRLFFDQNQNKINDPGEPGIPNGKTYLSPDSSIAFSDVNGNYLMGSLGGQQTLAYANNLTGLVLFTDSTTYTFNATGSVTNKDFGFISTNPAYSIQVKDVYLFARCNTQQNVKFKVRNTSNGNYDVRAWIKRDPLMTFINAVPAHSSISNDTIYWELSNIAPYTEIEINALFLLPGAGSVLNFTPGAHSLNASNVVQQTTTMPTTINVFCAWDPNDKQVSPEGIFALNYTLMSDTLNYLIRFQNTGTDTAFNVVVLDTLDAELNFNTFELISSSHSMQTELETNGAISFTMDNILLPDSNVNEPGSHGYIRYRILAKAGLPDTTEITNTAYIFFDFNPGVVTNTTMNTLVYMLPVGIDEPGNELNVQLYPNPFSNSATLEFDNTSADRFTLLITDIAGKRVAPEQNTNSNKFTIDRNRLSGGIYFYRLSNTATSQGRTGKMVIE
ncbi:MAG: T9SS type A sorting domain-containing protein [Bacteroidota bacterium]|nr:T9SS type A sorting domain-containing protein [Bacteroidota bacterium]